MTDRNKYFLAAFIFVGLFFVYTYPLIFEFNASLLSSGPQNSDINQYIWNAFNFKHQFINSQIPFNTHFIFAPYGASLWMHTYTPLMSLFALPFNNAFLAINIFLLINFLIGALATMRIALLFNKNFLWAFLLGFIFAFNPYKFAHLGEHYHLIINAFIPLVFYEIIQIKKRLDAKSPFRFKNFLPIILFFVGSFLSDYYQFCYLLILGFLYFTLPFCLNYINTFKGKSIIIFSLLFFVFMHFLVRFLKIWGLDDKGAFFWGGDLISFFTPPINSWLYGNTFLNTIYQTKIYNAPETTDNVLFLGYAFAIVFVFFVFMAIKNRLTFSIQEKSFFFLSLILSFIAFPNLRILGHETINLPTSVLHLIPLLNNLRCPTRIAMILYLVLPLALLLVMNKAEENRPNKNYKLLNSKWIPLFLIFACILEFAPSKYYLMNTQRDMPAIYKQVAQEEKGNVFIIPFGLRDGMIELGRMNTNELFYQVEHRQAIMGGYISRLNSEIVEKYQKDSVVMVLLKYSSSKELELLKVNQSLRTNFFSNFEPSYFLIKKEFRSDSLNKFLSDLFIGKNLMRKEIEGDELISIY